MAGVVAVALAVVAPVLAAGVNGTWTGRFIIPQEVGNIPFSAYPPAKLVVTAASVSAQFHGKTQAAHDPETAVSTCVVRLRFNSALSSDGWRLYEGVGKAVLTGSVGGGPPEMSRCQVIAGSSRLVLRLRPAGAKLKAEFGQRDGKGEPEFGPGGFLGYLHH
jgi:hypothetical protein